jgi:serine/threonine protein kinase/DNA-binding beta-propeller fold protein YncE
VSDEGAASGEFGVGSRLAGYRLDEPIGRGGMAVVYRAFDTRLQRRVALKILAPELARDQEFRQRFIRESRAAAAVDHPNIIPIFEAGEVGGVLFITMRFVDGRDVQTLIDSQGPLPVQRACDIVTQVASALDAAHASGLVHRDVKPANMLRDPAAGTGHADHVYLSDFGLSKRSLSSTGLTAKGHFLGTLNYVAPEQIEGRGVDGRSDQYALACSVFEMLAGVPPFKQDETLAIMWAQMSTAPPALTTRRPELPAAVDEVMAKALAKAPDDRYATCLEFAAALRRACGLDPGAAAPSPPEPRRQPTQAVNPADLAAAAAAAAPLPGFGGPSPDAAPAPTPTPESPPPPQPGPTPERAPSPQWPPPPQPGPTPERAPLPQPTANTPQSAIGGGQPTQAAASPGVRGTPPWSPSAPASPGYSPPPRPPRRSSGRAWLAVIAAGVVVAGVGGYVLLGRGGHKTSPPALLPPPCTSQVAKAKRLSGLPMRRAATGGQPFAAVVSGGFGFVTLINGLAVMNTAKFTPSLIRTIPLSRAKGEALTPDQKYLLVTRDDGLTVFRAADLEQGLSTPLGSLSSPGGRGAVQVALSPDARFAFVTLQQSGQVAVFNLRRALTQGFGPSDLVRTIPVGREAIGIAASANGRNLYVTSGLAETAAASGKGSLVILDMRKAETRSGSPIVKTVDAGCGPARVVPSADGKDVWVTVGGGNALIAYSAAKLISDPSHALIARVAVGQIPLGMVMLNKGTRIVIADSDRDNVAGAVPDLVVIDVSKALAGKPAVLGAIRSGKTPRQFALEPNGTTLLVTNTGAGQVRAINIRNLP